MSKYGTLETEIKEQKHLIAALAEMGYQAEVHPAGAPLVGYEGHERPERANVIIRRRQLDSSSDSRPDQLFGGIKRHPDFRVKSFSVFAAV